jgi:hypothetical protein
VAADLLAEEEVLVEGVALFMSHLSLVVIMNTL